MLHAPCCINFVRVERIDFSQVHPIGDNMDDRTAPDDRTNLLRFLVRHCAPPANVRNVFVLEEPMRDALFALGTAQDPRIEKSLRMVNQRLATFPRFAPEPHIRPNVEPVTMKPLRLLDRLRRESLQLRGIKHLRMPSPHPLNHIRPRAIELRCSRRE